VRKGVVKSLKALYDNKFREPKDYYNP